MYIFVTYIMKYHGKNEEQVFSLVLSKKYSRIRAFNEDTLKSRSKLLKEVFIKGWSERCMWGLEEGNQVQLGDPDIYT